MNKSITHIIVNKSVNTKVVITVKRETVKKTRWI